MVADGLPLHQFAQLAFETTTCMQENCKRSTDLLSFSLKEPVRFVLTSEVGGRWSDEQSPVDPRTDCV